ncbi:hypothetical protein J6590_092056 [Homalodisca vitripennis]|nr:hypothetical protein J6590_092056 [Homalodisca vitripennis]
MDINLEIFLLYILIIPIDNVIGLDLVMSCYRVPSIDRDPCKIAGKRWSNYGAVKFQIVVGKNRVLDECEIEGSRSKSLPRAPHKLSSALYESTQNAFQ